MKLSEFGKLRPQTKTILQELNSYVPDENKEDMLESRASHVIESAINLLESIEEHYDPEVANMLQRRLLNSIRGKDSRKFTRCIKKLKGDENGS